jgi:hypothetical protein
MGSVLVDVLQCLSSEREVKSSWDKFTRCARRAFRIALRMCRDFPWI